VKTGAHPPGTLQRWPLSNASAARTLGGSHEADLETTLALGAALGYEIPAEIALLVAEALDLETVRMQMTPAVAAAVPRAAALAAAWVEFGTLSLPEAEA
jgi:hydrogenase maturation protease